MSGFVWNLEKNGLLAKQQCGYRANRSTVDHLICLETFIRDAFIQNQHLVAVFFDLQKAYDTTWKHGIQQDLHDMGLRGNLPIFIGNFLTDRTTVDHLIRPETFIRDAFIQNQHLVALFLDLQRAYDIAWKHGRLSYKIYMTWVYVGICPFLLETFYPIELFKFF